MNIEIVGLMESVDFERDLFTEAVKPKIDKSFFVCGERNIPRIMGEFWTAKQRQASSIHEIAYRACFKPQLPAFFIKSLTTENDIVYDPFGGRGTTVIEAALLGRNVISNDINPLSEILTRPRLEVPDWIEIKKRLDEIKFEYAVKAEIDLSMFFHPDTESEIVSLKNYLKSRRESGLEDSIDRWIRMVSTNRLTGHSSGFFSVYTLPPNQATSRESQIKINEKLKQVPSYRNTKEIIIKKTKSLLSGVTADEKKNLKRASRDALFLIGDARKTRKIKKESVQLTVTSPPFLDIVQYAKDNWLRCWFNSVDSEEISKEITMSKKIDDWSSVMREVFKELYRITKQGGWVAFEVGEVRNSSLNLDEYVIPLGVEAGFSCEAVMINTQNFTKTSNIWGIKNNSIGTNSNRIVLFRREKNRE